MPLAPGTRLGAYEVLAAIGAGGMGEVYKARDTRLDRIVAIKVLPESFAADDQLRERFNREARAISQLDHPNICTLYDVGEQDPTGSGPTVAYLVMQYLEGETLEARLKKGALSVDQALQCAVQVADALDTAHRAGLVHRDLKPGNIMLTKLGAKLLDFGLAKATTVAAATNVSMLPTTPPGVTGQGTILGTFQYMAPEQLEGEEVDARTDIFAFGVVLYEMITGRKAFEGKSQASLIAAIMHVEPAPISSLQALIPPALERTVRICVAKSPDDRWQSARDLGRELSWIRESAPADVSPHSTASSRGKVLGLSTSAAILAVGTALALAWSLRRVAPVAERSIARFALTLPSSEQFTGLDRQFVAISPDGKRIVYVANNRLSLRNLDELESVPIRGTEGGAAALSPLNPFFSPDGQSVGFWQGGQLKRVPVTGGTATVLCAAPRTAGASWGADDTVVFAGGPQGVWRVNGAGGTPELLVKVGEQEGALSPQILPGTRLVLFTLRRNVNDSTSDQTVVQSLDGGNLRVVVDHASSAHYVPTGHLLYFAQPGSGGSGGTLVATAVDSRTLVPHGGLVPVVEGVRRSTTAGTGQFSVSETGTLVFVPGLRESMTLVRVDRQGREEPIPAEPRPYGYPRISPDGTQVAVASIGDEQNQAIWVWDLSKANLTKLTFAPDNFVSPVWGSDGKSVVFAGRDAIERQSASGAGRPERIVTRIGTVLPDAMTPDGTSLVVRHRVTDTGWNLELVSMEGDHKVTPLLSTPFNERFADLSPDGRLIAYQSDESGPDEIYVRPFPRVDDGKWQVSRGGGSTPVWSRNGRELFYLAPGGRMMAVAVQTQPTFSWSPPVKLFEGSFRSPSEARHFDVTPDGRFLMIKQSGGFGDAPRLIVVENWLDELKRRVPTK